MSSLSIQLDAVKESPHAFHLVSEPEWWQGARVLFPEPGLRLISPFTLDLSGYRLGMRLLFRGEMSGSVSLRCGRCAESYEHRFLQPVELLLEPARPDRDPPEGIVLDPEDLALGTYQGDELDFSEVLRELLVLDWPMQPRCGESCLGLCPVCGTNRNLTPCSCDASAASRPFAGLGQLLERSKGGR